MHRPGSDPANMQACDFLCDFCGNSWSPERPMIEGHQGSLVCGACLSMAYAAVVLAGADDPALGNRCTMCLETRPEAHWSSPLREGARICRRCIELAARQLQRDRGSGWRIPDAAP